MNTKTGILVGILAVVLMMGLWMVGVYNDLVGKDQTVKQSWAQVENQLQRRYDLIPNLVSTVKGYATHEKELFENVTKARSAWSGAGNANEKIAASGQLEGFLSRLMVVVENYPQLKAAENFKALQDELAGTENRVAVARMRYNDIVTIYNTNAKSIPTVFFVNMFGFDKEKLFFQSVKEAGSAPNVKF
ncbi:MAG: LemA family protein [Candidatus Margulisiibacteriota bacterium]